MNVKQRRTACLQRTCTTASSSECVYSRVYGVRSVHYIPKL
jgi:hypothetical protein